MQTLLPFALVLALLPQDAGSDPGMARRYASPVIEVVQRAKPAVVYIRSNRPQAPRRGFFGLVQMPDAETTGSGVVLYEDGYIVTNYHVVQGATRLLVTFDAADDPAVYEAKLVSASPEEDLALLKIEGERSFPTIPLCTTDPILGESVVAIGNPLGQTHTVSDGIVSGLHRDISIRDPESGQVLRFTNLIQTDAAINPGNSGGPLLTVNGELLGINSSMNMGAENIGFAIPVAQVRRVLEEKLLNPDYARAWLGFEATPSDFRVTSVVADGPAALAGLRIGDHLAVLGESKLESEEAWRLARLNAQPGQDLAVEFVRDGRRSRASLKPWNRLDAQLYDRLGLRVQVEKFDPGWRELLKITQVRPDGPATSFRRGDVIEGVQATSLRAARSVSSSQDLLWVLSRVQAGDVLTLWVYRDEDGDGVFEDEPDHTERFKGKIVLR